MLWSGVVLVLFAPCCCFMFARTKLKLLLYHVRLHVAVTTRMNEHLVFPLKYV